MGWRLAESLKTLRGQINAVAPDRSKASDGSVGDLSHQSRASEHNPMPFPGGVVCAIDVTHDPAHGADMHRYAEALRLAAKSGTEKRLKYIIFDGRICSVAAGWAWRKYNGPSAHRQHMHVSVLLACCDDSWPWRLGPPPKRFLATAGPVPAERMLRAGSRGLDVEQLQRDLTSLGYARYGVTVTGLFAAGEDRAVRAFQTAEGLKSDGHAGPVTLTAITTQIERRRDEVMHILFTPARREIRKLTKGIGHVYLSLPDGTSRHVPSAAVRDDLTRGGVRDAGQTGDGMFQLFPPIDGPHFDEYGVKPSA